MHIYRDLAYVPSDAPRVVATIGNFDGVHLGHQWVMEQVRTRAAAAGIASMVITFDPHPSRTVRPGTSRKLITPTDQKLELLSRSGIDFAIVLPFTDDLARTSARDFAQSILRDRLRVTELHEGENFRFGHEAEAGVETLKELGAQLGFTVFAYAPRQLHGGAISSSRIRDLIGSGKVSAARRLLGRPFTVQGRPSSGRGYGARYAVPTINLAPYEELLPAHGVYITRLRIGRENGGEVFDSVTNVGNRPTFGQDSFAVESHLLDFHPLTLAEDTPMELRFLHHLRVEQRWPNPAALRAQIGRDVAATRRFFSLARVLQQSAEEW